MPGNVVPQDDQPQIVIGLQIVSGCVAVLGAAAVAAITVPSGHLIERILIMTVVVGVYAGVATDVRAVLTVTVGAMVISTVLLANDFGEFTANSQLVGYLVPIAFGALLGRGQRW